MDPIKVEVFYTQIEGTCMDRFKKLNGKIVCNAYYSIALGYLQRSFKTEEAPSSVREGQNGAWEYFFVVGV